VHLHFLGGQVPLCSFQVELGPLGLSRFAWAHEQQRRKLQGAPRDERALLAVDCAQQATHGIRFDDGGVVHLLDWSGAPRESAAGWARTEKRCGTRGAPRESAAGWARTEKRCGTRGAPRESAARVAFGTPGNDGIAEDLTAILQPAVRPETASAHPTIGVRT